MYITGLLLVLAATVAAENAPLDSFRRARALVERSAAAHGVQTGPLRVDVEGDLYQITQSARPEPPFLRTPYRETVIIDGERLRYSRVNEWPYFTNRRTTMTTADGLVELDDSSGVASRSGDTLAQVRSRLSWRAPAMIIAAARRAGASLRWLRRDGDREVLVYADEQGRLNTITVDAKSARIAALSWLDADPLLGDLVYEVAFDGDRVETRRNGVAYASFRVTTSAARIDEATFTAPAPQTAAAPAPMYVFEELAPNVMLIRNAGRADYHSLLALFEDFSAIVEPVGGAAGAEKVLAEVASRYPKQPVRYVAATHHHDDHIGGIRRYAAANVTLIVPDGSARWFRSLLTMPHTIRPDLLAAGSAKPVVKRASEAAKFADAANAIEFIEAGPNDHSESVLIAWLPRSGILFQGDLFRGSRTPEPARPAAVALLEKIERSGLEVRVVAGVHGETVTLDDLRKSVSARKSSTAR